MVFVREGRGNGLFCFYAPLFELWASKLLWQILLITFDNSHLFLGCLEGYVEHF